MKHTDDFSNLEELKNEYKVFGEELDNQYIINDELMGAAMKRKLNQLFMKNRVGLLVSLVLLLIAIPYVLMIDGLPKLPMVLFIACNFLLLVLGFFSMRSLGGSKLYGLDMTAMLKKTQRYKKYLVVQAIVLILLITALGAYLLLTSFDSLWGAIMLICPISVYAIYAIIKSQRRYIRSELDPVIKKRVPVEAVSDRVVFTYGRGRRIALYLIGFLMLALAVSSFIVWKKFSPIMCGLVVVSLLLLVDATASLLYSKGIFPVKLWRVLIMALFAASLACIGYAVAVKSMEATVILLVYLVLFVPWYYRLKP